MLFPVSEALHDRESQTNKLGSSTNETSQIYGLQDFQVLIAGLMTPPQSPHDAAEMAAENPVHEGEARSAKAESATPAKPPAAFDRHIQGIWERQLPHVVSAGRPAAPLVMLESAEELDGKQGFASEPSSNLQACDDLPLIRSSAQEHVRLPAAKEEQSGQLDDTTRIVDLAANRVDRGEQWKGHGPQSHDVEKPAVAAEISRASGIEISSAPMTATVGQGRSRPVASSDPVPFLKEQANPVTTVRRAFDEPAAAEVRKIAASAAVSATTESPLPTTAASPVAPKGQLPTTAASPVAPKGQPPTTAASPAAPKGQPPTTAASPAAREIQLVESAPRQAMGNAPQVIEASSEQAAMTPQGGLPGPHSTPIESGAESAVVADQEFSTAPPGASAELETQDPASPADRGQYLDEGRAAVKDTVKSHAAPATPSHDAKAGLATDVNKFVKTQRLDAVVRPVVAGPAPSVGATGPTSVPQQVIRMLEAGRPKQGEAQRLTLQLEPAHLGRVEVQLAMRGDRLEVVIQVESASAAAALRENLHDLTRALAGKVDGRVAHVEVRIIGDGGQDTQTEDQDSEPNDRSRDEQRREQRRREQDGRQEA